MSPRDTGFPRDPEAKKRMLPSVTDVVRELAKVVSADPAVLFKAARGVVAEELAKVKQGLESAPLDVLVRRALLQLEREGSAKPVSGTAAPFTPVFPARRPGPRGAGKAAPPASPPAPDEPFENAPSGAELGWEKELPIQPEDAPFQSAILPIPARARGPLEISAPADTPPRPVPEAMPKPAPAPQPELELELEFVPPPPAPKPPEAAPPPFAPHEPAAKSMSDLAPLREMQDDNPEPAVEEFHFKAAEIPAPVPARSSGRGWLVAIALVLVIGAGLAWAVREYVFRNESVRPVAPVARRKPDAAPAATVEAPAPAPALAAKAPSPAKAAPAPAKQAAARPPSSAALPKGGAAWLLTPDWTGKPDVYVIHFSSHKDRESAAVEARKLGAALGAPARAVEVDLGEKGVWYRVVLGEFADVDAARAFRADLEAKKTPGMGFVYEMRGR